MNSSHTIGALSMDSEDIDEISRHCCHQSVVERIINGQITAQSLLLSDETLNLVSAGGNELESNPVTASQAIEEFLCWVYEQIDELLSQCSTQTRSLTSTPVSSSVTPQQAERQHEKLQHISAASAPAKVDVLRLSHSAASTSQHGRRSVDAYSDRREKSRGDTSDGKSKTMRRIKLFSANQSESHDKSGDFKSATELTNSDVRPLSSSTPSHNRSNHSLTLAVFMTPERRKQRRTPHKPQQALANPFISPPCGSWSTNSGNITPLRAICNITTPDRSLNRSGDSSTSDSSPYRNEADSTCDEIDGSTSGGLNIKKLETLTEDKDEDATSQQNSLTADNSHRQIKPAPDKSDCVEVSGKKGKRITPTAIQSTQQPSRRITPTPVSSNRSWSSGFKQQAVFTPQSPQKSQSAAAPKPGSFSEERSKLREKKVQMMSLISSTAEIPGSSGVKNAVTPSKSATALMRAKSVAEEVCVEPDPDKVSCHSEIVRTAKVFAQLITGGKTRNMSADLHLLVQVFCCRVPVDQAKDSKPIPESSTLLCSVHNMIFFAAHVLSNCKVLLDMMDSSVRRLMSRNDRLVKYAPDLCQTLNDHKPQIQGHASQSSFSSVSFQAETDNSSNFPTERNFIIFKKQRDMFYELKRQWENNHTVPGWSLQTNCSVKLAQLFDMSSHDLSNYVHFSRLFVNQLLISCLKDLDESWVDTDDASLTLLQNLKVTQPEKYRKLRERFVTPLTAPAAQQDRQATFEKAELFFKTFIDSVNESRFTQHLKEMLTMKLIALHGMLKDMEPSDDTADIDITSSVEHFSDSILSSRLLAKFLGYVTFSPYQCNDSKTLASDEQYKLLRISCPPPLDIKTMLHSAIQECSMYAFLPWLVQYLGQIDVYGMSLPYYVEVLRLLTMHYNKVKKHIAQFAITESLLLEYASLSWLFNLEQFQTLPMCDIPSTKKKNGLLTTNPQSTTSKLVGLRLVYDCCMVLQCVKCTLVQFVMGMNNKVVTSRKITPLTSTHTEKATPKAGLMVSHPSQATVSTLQQTLEENFFQNQPASLKKSCDFIAERVSSSYIKDFRANSLLNVLTEAKTYMLTEAEKIIDTSEIRERMVPVVQAKCFTTHSTLHKLALDGVDQYFESRVSEIFTLLLPPDSEKHIVTICRGVVIRQGFERVTKWLNSNLTCQYISAELNQEVTKFIRTGSGSGQCKQQTLSIQLHSETTLLPSDAILNLQAVICKVTSKESCSVSEVELVVSQAVQCVLGYPEILNIAVKSICQLIIILLLELADSLPEYITAKVLTHVETLFMTEALGSIFSDLSSLFPKGDEVDSDSLYEQLLSYILVKKNLLKS